MIDAQFRAAFGQEARVADPERVFLFRDHLTLLGKVMPDYPPAAKRIIRDNGIWASTLKRNNVHLVTEPITEICATGLRLSDGTTHDADVIIYGTGFQASRFLTPMRVTGRDGAARSFHLVDS